MYSAADAGWLSNTVRALYSADSTAELSMQCVNAVHTRFEPVSSSCEEVARDNSQYIAHHVRTEVRLPPEFAVYIHDCPTVPCLRAPLLPPTMRLSEISTQRDWERTDHFNGLARPVGFRDQVLVVANTGSQVAVVGLYRKERFTGTECALLAILQPHFLACWMRLRPPAARLTGVGSPEIILSAQLEPVTLSAEQHQLLCTYFPGHRAAALLPIVLRQWLLTALQRLEGPMRQCLRPYCANSIRGQLLVRFFPGDDGRPPRLGLMETPASPNFFALSRHGLTSRECEVLYWIAQGKRDAEVALLLTCAKPTVSKHVEHILSKLQAENRAAAVRAAYQLLRT